jgi:hypothetical protein
MGEKVRDLFEKMQSAHQKRARLTLAPRNACRLLTHPARAFRSRGTDTASQIRPLAYVRNPADQHHGIDDSHYRDRASISDAVFPEETRREPAESSAFTPIVGLAS